MLLSQLSFALVGDLQVTEGVALPNNSLSTLFSNQLYLVYSIFYVASVYS